jgi:signal transduction histidine kinase
MKSRSRSIIILSILFGYILLQFLWWEILLVKQNGIIINEKQKLVELSTTNEEQLREEINLLHHKKKMQTVMIVSEGTVFLLLLLFGLYKIKQAMDKETALNNQQKNFFLSVTHELKTPISATKLQLQTMQKQKLDDDTRGQLIRNALQETERLNVLIDNILLASRLENNEFTFSHSRQNLSELVSSIVERYYPAELKNGELICNIGEQIYAQIDQHAFPSVITNLIDNALKYSTEVKKITLSLLQKKNQVILAVSDEGIGISDEEKPRIFSRFYRAGNEDTRRTKGTGLGLYIVNYIVQKHNGRVRVSDHKPRGTNFEVELHAA